MAKLPEALDPLLAALVAEKTTGIITATRAPVRKRIVVEKGDVVFATSDDPRDLIGQALIRAGAITERDLLAALEASRSETGAGPKLAAVLTAMRKVTPEQTKAVFEGKIRESVLDLFLWDIGHIEFAQGGVERSDVPFPLLLKLDVLRAEGTKRRARWVVVKKVLRDPEAGFERVAPTWGEGFPATAGDKKLASLIEQGLPLSGILAELRGQDYAVSVRLTTLVQTGVLRVAERAGFIPTNVANMEIDVDVDAMLAGGAASSSSVSDIPTGQFTKVVKLPGPGGGPIGELPSPAPAPAVTEEAAEAEAAEAAGMGTASLMLELAQQRFAEGKLDEAQVLLMEGIGTDPLSAEAAWMLLQEVEEALGARARANGLGDDVKLRLAKPVQQMVGLSLAASEAFIMSRFAAGPMTVGALLGVCPFQPHEVLQILEKRLNDGTLART